MSDMDISILKVSHNFKNNEWLEDFPLLGRRMQDVKLAFTGNKIERHFQQVHGAQTYVCNLFIATFVDL
jgi:hypothetical protein